MDAGFALLIGTTKGAFLLESGPDRTDWSLRGPYCDGWPINHIIADPVRRTLWAAGGGEWPGAGVWRSDDDGATWTLARLANGRFDAWLSENPGMAEEFGMQPAAPAPYSGDVDAVWSLGCANGRLYAGTKPAALFVSEDRGTTWSRVQGLTDHPSSDGWEPGGAGLTLHSIVISPEDPGRMWVGISAAGVFATENGGAAWERRNRRANFAACEERADVGLCVHNIVRAPSDGTAARDVLYQQNHHGVFRSPDGGRSWQEISAGLPSTFGFPVAVHPREAGTIWVLPLNGDTQGRYPPEASAAVWKSHDGGETWAPKQSGLPKRDCFFTVLRQAMATDKGTPAGVYFGTNSGSVFASADEGETWIEAARHLPTILCVETLERH